MHNVWTIASEGQQHIPPLSTPSGPNMDTSYMGMLSASVITPHGISQKMAEHAVTELDKIMIRYTQHIK